jgi:hypothetical protein
MSTKDEFMEEIKNIGKRDNRPFIEVWPDDEFADWVSRHTDKVRNVICHTPEFSATPYCGVGYNQ